MGGQAWDAKLFDCFSECKICLVSCFCTTCQLAYQKATVEGHECGFMDFLCIYCFGFCCAIKIRGDIRNKYGIDGGCFGDFLTILYCGLCAIVQQQRQLILKGDKPAGCMMS